MKPLEVTEIETVALPLPESRKVATHVPALSPVTVVTKEGPEPLAGLIVAIGVVPPQLSLSLRTPV